VQNTIAAFRHAQVKTAAVRSLPGRAVFTRPSDERFVMLLAMNTLVSSPSTRRIVAEVGEGTRNAIGSLVTVLQSFS
jgi:hypothetical protein